VVPDLADSIEDFDKGLLAQHIGEIEQRIEKTEPGSALDKLITRLDHYKDVDRHLTGTAMH
jgi:F-type H+-transporting ATPase subunit epsilon